MTKKVDLDDEGWSYLFAYQQDYFKKYGQYPKIRSVLKYCLKVVCGQKHIKPINGPLKIEGEEEELLEAEKGIKQGIDKLIPRFCNQCQKKITGTIFRASSKSGCLYDHCSLACAEKTMRELGKDAKEMVQIKL